AADDPNALAKLRALSAADVLDGVSVDNEASPETLKTYSMPVADRKINVQAITAYQSGAFMKVPVMIGATSDDIGGREGYMTVGARQLAGLLSTHSVSAYYYRFSYVAETARTAGMKGALHGSDVPFFLDTLSARYGAHATAEDRTVSRMASEYLINFVKTG